MLCHVAPVRIDVSEGCITSIIRMINGELGTALAVTSNQSMLVTLMMEVIHSSITSILTRATWHNIPVDGILHSHHSENLKS
jgi:hypothetical protein